MNLDPVLDPSIGLIGGIGMAGSVIAGLLAIIFAATVIIMPRGTKAMRDISFAICKGAMAFMIFEYLCLSAFTIVLFVVVSVIVNWQTGLCFLTGTFVSASAGAIGMLIATQANTRTTAAARWSMLFALRTAFHAGAVLGFSIVCVGLGGVSFFLLVFGTDAIDKPPYLAGFGLGCTVVSLFSRVGGGIFTKAADVGADLVGKVEKDLPEDDIRNPATIADNVGDNVGDIAGMSSDLCGSYVGSLIASCVLGYQKWGLGGAGFPIWFCVFGVISSFVGHMTVWCRNNAGQFEVLMALRVGLFLSNCIQLGFMALCVYLFGIPWKYFAITVMGVICGFLISLISEVFTSGKYYFTRSIARAGHLGPAAVIIQGLAVGMYSMVTPAILCAATLLGCILIGGAYGAAIGSTALLSNLAFTLTMDAMGAVSDNAGGIAEMAELDARVRERTDTLDAVGNTTAAVGKSFAVTAALLTGFALINMYKTQIEITSWDAATDGYAVSGLLIGAMIPYFFSAMTMQAVSTCAQAVIVEVRRQLKAKPEILTGEKKADHARCVINITASSIHAMIGPSFVVIMIPILVGIWFPPQFLLSLLLGNTMSGFCLSTLLSNSGGSFDNAKKYSEQGKLYTIDEDTGEKIVHGKGSDAHKALICGDTVGDPFKDTSGPSINICTKLSNYMSVTLAPFFIDRESFWWSAFIIFMVAVAFIVPVMIFSPIRVLKLVKFLQKKLKKPKEDALTNDDKENCSNEDVEMRPMQSTTDEKQDELGEENMQGEDAEISDMRPTGYERSGDSTGYERPDDPGISGTELPIQSTEDQIGYEKPVDPNNQDSVV